MIIQYFSTNVSAIFVAPFNSEWKENKKFAVQALKNTGFGTAKSEQKILNEVAELIKHIENQNQFQPKEFLDNTTANALISILLNQRYEWYSEELNRVIKVTGDFNSAFSDMFVLDFAQQYLPTFMMKLIFRSKIKACRTKGESLKQFLREHVEEHRRTLDPNNIRDFIDIYLKEGKDKEMSEDLFINTLCAFFPDGTSTAADAMNWSFIYLAYHPEEQKAAQKQLDEVRVLLLYF